MNIIGRKKLYFILSGIVIIPGLISLLLYGLRLGIDFTGGSNLEIATSKSFNIPQVQKIVLNQNVAVHSIRSTDSKSIIIRTQPLEQKEKTKIESALKTQYPDLSEKSFETVGPVVGNETKNKAITAVLIASLVITLFIAWAFREVSRPIASWKFGVCAVLALLHDLLVVVGIYSILGKVFGIEIDSLFITALLTVMGFSIHDTIVVFDRIRENLRKNPGYTFEQVVNNSMLETLNRSLNTSITVILVLTTLALFGGESIRWFVIALLIGIISGTYSSIFNASPLLVAWYEWDKRDKRLNIKNQI